MQRAPPTVDKAQFDAEGQTGAGQVGEITHVPFYGGAIFHDSSLVSMGRPADARHTTILIPEISMP